MLLIDRSILNALSTLGTLCKSFAGKVDFSLFEKEKAQAEKKLYS